MEVVNGYVCRDCAEASLAARGVNPARPGDGPNGIFAHHLADGLETANAVRRADAAEPPRAASLHHQGALVDVRA